MTRRTSLWLLPIIFAAHNAEEALTFPGYLPVVQGRAPLALRPIVSAVSYPQMLVALAVATALPVAVAVWNELRPRSSPALWAALLLTTVMLLNVATHISAAVFVLRGYSPGLVTALALNLPYSLYVLSRAVRERWLSRAGLVSLLPAALVVHGPLLVGLIMLAGLALR